MKKATIQLETLTCPSCIAKIEGALKKVDGVDDASTKISFSSSRVRLDFDDSKTSIEAIENSITKMGYSVEKSRVA
ncbi:MAG: heavy-metal-associated domain-containing protein [Erysipelothrix sp.]|nr:heavy-metal-associated domain-containing protein [Erysipelothrix sp.]